jgi:hypothetical protein
VVGTGADEQAPPGLKILIFQNSKLAQICKFKIDTFHCYKNSQTLHDARFEYFEKTFSIGSNSNSQHNPCYKFWNIFKFESSMNFKGVQTLWEKSEKFSKILT